MTHANRALLALMAVLAAIAVSSPVFGADKVGVLIIDGQNVPSHDWKATTPVIKEALVKTERFNVDVLTAPDAKAPKEDWAKFKPEFSKYAAVLINYRGTPWPEEVQKSFEKYVADGGGLVVYHFTVAAWPEWEAWNKMIGLGWRDNKFGDRIYLDDAGKEVRQPKGEGPGAGHGPAHVFEVMTRDANHPIMKGMPEKWTHVKDELYGGQRGPAQNMHILATAFSSKEGKGTGYHEPMAWTIPCGKGRVFVDLLGHDAAATAAPSSSVLLCRGTEWAATGQVTIPAPKDLSAAPAAPPAPKKE